MDCLQWIGIETFLMRWQSLAGAALGAIAGVLAIVLLHYLTRSSNKKDAAYVVYLELIRFRQHTSAAFESAGNSERYQKAVEGKGGPEIQARHVLASILARARMTLSPVYHQAVGSLASGDMEVALKLSMFQSFHDAAERLLATYERFDDRVLWESIREGAEAPVLAMLNSSYEQTQHALKLAEVVPALIETLYMEFPLSPLRRGWRRMNRKNLLKRLQRENAPRGG